MLCLGSYCGCEGPVRPLHRRNTRKNWESQIWDGGRNLWGSICENDPIGWMYRISRDLCWLDRDDMAGTWYVSHYWWGWAQLVNTTQPASCRKQGRGRGGRAYHGAQGARLLDWQHTLPPAVVQVPAGRSSLPGSGCECAPSVRAGSSSTIAATHHQRRRHRSSFPVSPSQPVLAVRTGLCRPRAELLSGPGTEVGGLCLVCCGGRAQLSRGHQPHTTTVTRSHHGAEWHTSTWPTQWGSERGRPSQRLVTARPEVDRKLRRFLSPCWWWSQETHWSTSRRGKNLEISTVRCSVGRMNVCDSINISLCSHQLILCRVFALFRLLFLPDKVFRWNNGLLRKLLAKLHVLFPKELLPPSSVVVKLLGWICKFGQYFLISSSTGQHSWVESKQDTQLEPKHCAIEGFHHIMWSLTKGVAAHWVLFVIINKNVTQTPAPSRPGWAGQSRVP